MAEELSADKTEGLNIFRKAAADGNSDIVQFYLEAGLFNERELQSTRAKKQRPKSSGQKATVLIEKYLKWF